jgi:hypothetical protein
MPPEAVAALVVVGFTLWWCFVLWLSGWMSGWRALARHYRTDGPFHGRIRRFQSIALGWGNYGGVTTVGTRADGLYLAVLLPFRPGHPPLFIPWGEVTSAEFGSRWYGDWLELRFAAAPRVRLRLSGRLGKLVAADANRSWAVGEPGVE